MPAERVQEARARATAEQVHAAAPQLARARSGEHEAHAALLDEPVHLVEEDRQLLDLVDDDQPILRRQLLPEATGALAERQEHLGIEQVVDLGSRQGVADQRRLAGLAGSQQEQRFPRREARQIEGAGDVGSRLSQQQRLCCQLS